uniref:TFIIB-type zinc ribbon-containing protein n=1 Tax=Aliarcobacter sp. TaxID=2321116 RepID=UPI0040489DDF
MKCPVCKDVDLVISDRQGVEIDYCPSCRGVWLDRGELDKIIERSSNFTSHQSQNSYKQSTPNYNSNNNQQNGYYKKKKSSFLSDIFDF